MNKSIDTLQDVITSMEEIYDELAPIRDKITRKINMLEGKRDYIRECEYIPDSVKEKELSDISIKQYKLIVELMNEIQRS